MLFSQLKSKLKSIKTEWSYQDFLASFLVGMFDVVGAPVGEYALRLLEMLLLTETKAAVYFSSYYKRWIVGTVKFTGFGPDEYGDLPDASCFDMSGHEDVFTDWKNSEKCFVFFNTRQRTGDINIERFADLMAKLDISINANIVNSRMFPVVVAPDSKTQAQVSEALQASEDGATKVITTKLGISDLLKDTGKSSDLYVLNITDVNASDKIQYLNHASDDLLRRFLAIYGININGTGKMAQQSRDEVNGSNNAAFVVPTEMLKARRDGWRRFSEVTGINVFINFSESLERELAETEANTMKATAEARKAEEEAREAARAAAAAAAPTAAEEAEEAGEEEGKEEGKNESDI